MYCIDEKKTHLAVLCTQWEARQTKSSSEKVASISQVHCLLEEAVAVKLELYKEELLQYATVQDNDVNIKMLKLLQEKQDKACQSFIPVGSLVSFLFWRRLYFYVNLTHDFDNLQLESYSIRFLHWSIL